ncbi:MAG: hypothetical protein EBX41_04745 [Chitinophagia bacterium]|nr:hypothetical protein [Chitinophagia bacterium]
MRFKIDTKGNYLLITPLFPALTLECVQKLSQLITDLSQNGSNAYIVDFTELTQAEDLALPKLEEIHNNCYALNHSVVYTNVDKALIQAMKKTEIDLIINIAPTMQEAVDIINMEHVARDWFGDEPEE